MSVPALLEAFQALNSLIPGVVSAPYPQPPTLEGAELPTVITFPGPAIWHPAGGLGSARITQRTYVCRFYVAPADSGDVADAFGSAFDLLEAAGQTYRATTEIGGAVVLHGRGFAVNAPAPGIEDLGFLTTIRYYAAQFFGFEFRIPVLETV